MNLARRNLIQDKTRFGLSVIGVALAVMLILILSGFLNGMYRQISAYLDHTPGSIVVAQGCAQPAGRHVAAAARCRWFGEDPRRSQSRADPLAICHPRSA
jgi:hypothetical protein